MINLVCAICGSNKNCEVLYPANFSEKFLTGKTFSARRIPDGAHYQFLKCKKCSLIFSSPIISLGKITKLYKDSEFTYTKESKFLADTYGSYLKKILPENNINKIKLLDVGCGNGFFLEKAISYGIENVYGVEPGKASIEKSKKNIKNKIKNSILKKGLFKPNFFDIVCCFHTLDHVVDPNEFLKVVYQILKPGGKIIFVTHNTKGLSSSLFGEKSPIFDIEHIYLFNPETISKIFTVNKFKNPKIYNLKNRYPISYWLWLSPIQLKIKKIIISVINSLKIDFPISISAGNIAIIAEK